MLLGLLVSGIYAQADRLFIKHLAGTGLRTEHKAYLDELAGVLPSDSLHYYLAKYYLQSGEDSSFLVHYKSAIHLFQTDTQAFNMGSIHFLNKPAGIQKEWFLTYDKMPVNKPAQAMHYMYDASLDPAHVLLSSVPDKLQDDYLQFRKAYRKKPWMGATLSTFVPGLGKLYAGRRESAGMVFLMHVSYILQAYSSIQSLGIHNAFTIYSIGIFGVFYSANIYGSWKAVKEVKKEKRKQFLIHAEDYYRFDCAHNLYP
ncbi:MAG: hypothetical protein ACHQRM_12540 [Bacteroidia bacterium]